jgi:small conductance mechanosensitive channel
VTALTTPPTCQTEDWLCTTVLDRTDNQWLAAAADWLIAKPVAIAAIVLLALVVRWLANRVINRVVGRAGEGRIRTAPLLGRPRTAEELHELQVAAERRRQRADTMASVLRSITAFAVFTIAAIMVIGEIGYNVAPLIASAGLVGVALGFGAQSLVKDFLSGIFMFFEDQYGVGDRIILGDQVGVVEALSLRVTRLRADDGTVWYVRNGEILRVGNESQRSDDPDRPAVAEDVPASGDS